MINWTNVTDFSELPRLANESTGGNYFWTGMLYMMWIVLLFLMSNFGWETALIVSAFLGLILGVMGLYLGLISYAHTIVFAGIILLMIIYILVRNRRE
jgi:hypothetical protein